MTRSPQRTPLLAVLTDEEVEAAGGRSDLIPLPHLSVLPPAERSGAVAAAKRSLEARGVLDVKTSRPHSGGVLSDILHVRRHASGVLACARREGQSPIRVRYVFQVGAVRLVEDLDEKGVHRWRIVSGQDLPADLGRFLVPADARDGHGELRLDTTDLSRFSAPDDAPPPGSPATGPARDAPTALKVLGSATVTADVVVRTAGDGVDQQHPPALHGLFLGPRGTFRTCSVPGTTGPVLLHGMVVGDVGAWVSGLLQVATARGGAGRPVGLAEQLSGGSPGATTRGSAVPGLEHGLHSAGHGLRSGGKSKR